MHYVILSSLIYLSAYIYPTYLYPCIFIYMIPLLNKHLTFTHGYVWGLIVFGGNLTWLACIIYTKGQGDARMIVYVITVCYFALFSGFWFWFKQQLTGYVQNNITKKGICATSCCTWVISTATFFSVTCYCSFAILDCLDGLFFINPLLPLVSWQWWLVPISYFGTLTYWIIIVLINVTLAKLCKKLTINSLIFLLMLFGFPSLFSPRLKKNNINKDEIVYVAPTWNDMNLSQAEIFYAIARQLDNVAQDCPGVKFVMMPESAFPYNLLGWQDKLHAWTSLFDESVSIFIGAHRYEGDKKYNSLFQICDGNIVGWYDKTHLVPFVERIPWLFKNVPIFNSFLTKPEDVFCYSAERQTVLLRASYPMLQHGSTTADANANLMLAEFEPFICSELFCEGKRPAQGKPLLFICNDAWLALPYAQDLAKRYAKLYSLRYQLSIVYVGSYDMEIIN